MKFDTVLAGVPLIHDLMNGAGTCKLLEGYLGVRELARAPTAAIMVGSITIEPREVNEGDVFYWCPNFSLNSMGLPNPGEQYYWQNLPEMVNIAHAVDKPLFVSVAGFTPLEYARLADISFRRGVDLVELNLSCPNIWQDNQQKRIVCFDLGLVGEVLYRVEKEVGSEAKIAIKLSPFSDPFALGEIAKIIGQSKLVKAVTVSNTFPNAFDFNDQGKPRITPGGGLAGLSGPAIKSISLGQIKQLKGLLPNRIQFIGAGGITRGEDILDYEKVGAIVFQIATILLVKGAKVFGDILTDLVITREVRAGA